MQQFIARCGLALSHFLADLKRRRVFKVVAVYGAGAFAILQALDLLEPLLPLAGVYRFTGVLLLLGFPVAASVSWLYDYNHGFTRTAPATPEELDEIFRLPRARRWASGLLALGGLALLGITVRYAVHPGGAPPQSDPRPTLAVLPFANRSALADDAFFVEGLHDDILVQLSRVGSLRVISRTSVQRFRNSDLPLGAIADSLGASTILEGAVQRSGNRVRVSMQLVDARTERHLWAERWDKEVTPANLLAIQQALAVDIAKALEVSLGPEEEERLGQSRTQDLQAYDAFLMAQSRWSRLSLEETRQAVTLFQEAVDRDPRFAEARAGLAAAQAMLATFTARNHVVAGDFLVAEAQADTALALRPDLAYATLAKGIAELGARRNPAAADSLFRAALVRRPSDPVIRLWHARALMTFGRFDEAVEAIQEARLLDPLSPLVQAHLGLALWGAGRPAEADAALRRATELDPGYSFAYLEHAILMAQRNDEPQMRRDLVAFGRTIGYDRPDSLSVIALAVFRKRAPERGIAELDRFLMRTPIREGDVIPLLALLGAEERAAAALDLAEEQGSPWAPFFDHPLFAPLRRSR